MIKKLKKILILMLFMLPFSVNADTGEIKLECDKNSMVPGGVITCTIKGSSTGEVSSLGSKILLSSNLSLDSVSVDSIWVGDGEANLDLYSEENKTGTFNIAVFSVKASNNIINGSNESISIDMTKFYGADYKGYDVEKVTNDIRILSTINTLSGITLSNGKLSSDSTTNYSATVDVDKVTISATKTDSKSTISGSIGEVTLNYGLNTFKINVVSESGSTKVYTISITRNDNRDKNNSLSSLSFNGTNIELKSDIDEYSYEVENDVTQIRLEAVLGSNEAIFVENYGPRTVELKEGANVIEIKIMAENETIRTYTLNINRKSAGIDDNPGAGGNTEGGGDNSGNNNVPDSPPTGSLELYIVLAIVVISIAGVVYYFNQYQKKQGVNKDEKK